MGQLTLDMPFRAAYGGEDFLLADCNREAVGWIDRWPDWPGHVMILYGPAGSGKTHLCHVWQKITNAEPLDLEAWDILSEGNKFILDDAEKIYGLEEKLFHLYNWTKERRGFLLITARAHPKKWPLSLPDLKSRMLAAPAVEICAPDEGLLQALIIKQFADRQITVGQDVVNYLLLRMERSFEAVGRLVAAIDQRALSEKKKITVPLVRKVLESG